MIRWESSFCPSLINYEANHQASIGLGQVQLPTAKHFCRVKTKTELLDIEVNLDCAARYLKHQLDRYDGDYYKAISAYNAGTYWKRHTNSFHVKRILSYARGIGKERRLGYPNKARRGCPYR